MGSRDADIDFTFTRPITVRAVWDVLLQAGWYAEEHAGHISYMINGPDDLYEWFDSKPERLEEALTVLDAAANLPYTVAINVYHPEAETGGMLMFHPGRSEVSFVPTINRRRIPAVPESTDLAWYLHTLVPALLRAGLTGYEAREVSY